MLCLAMETLLIVPGSSMEGLTEDHTEVIEASQSCQTTAQSPDLRGALSVRGWTQRG